MEGTPAAPLLPFYKINAVEMVSAPPINLLKPTNLAQQKIEEQAKETAYFLFSV